MNRDEGDKQAWTAVLHRSPEALAALEREDLSHWRSWHETAVFTLAGRIRADDGSVEADFLAVLERLANRLLLDDPEGFASLIDRVSDVPLASPRGRQLVSYFRGVSLARRDNYEAALTLFDRLLARPDLDDYIQGRTLNSRALYCRVTGRLAEAVEGYRACLTLWQRQDNRLREGLAWLNLGNIAHQLHESDEAEADLNQAAVCFEAAGSAQWLAAAQNSLGLVFRDRGEWQTAVSFFEAVVARRQEDGARDALGRVLTNLSETYLMQERLAEAAEAAEAALEALDTKVYAVDTYIALGLTRQVLGDLVAARKAFTWALETALEIGRKDILAEVHYRLGDVWRRLGDNEAALEQLQAGAAVIESTREPLREEGLKISLLGRWQQVYELLVLHLIDMGRTAAAFQWTERARARAFLEAVGQPLGAAEGLTAVTRLPEMAPRTALLSYFTTGVLDREIPWLRQLSPTSPLYQHLLPPARTIRFYLTTTGIIATDCGLNPNALAWTLPRGDDRHRFLETAVRRSLYDVLLPDGIMEEVERLFIVPHGPLHEVPFGALTGANEQPLISRNGPLLTFTPSAAFWRQRAFQAEEQRAEGCLAVGYDGRTGQGLLRHTEAEAHFVAGLTGGEAWVGAVAKTADLKERAARCCWLHIACHGRFLHDQPLDSYLETGLEDHLTAREVAANWQLKAELVTLSACQSGVSRVLRGDEPMGLVRAFLTAGARAVLVSQWAVADLPTFLLMSHFYEGIIQGRNPAAALKASQLWLRALTRQEVMDRLVDLPGDEAAAMTAKRPFAHPRHWAAFILVG